MLVKFRNDMGINREVKVGFLGLPSSLVGFLSFSGACLCMD